MRAALRLLPALVLVGVVIAFFVSGAGADLSLEGLSAHARAWRAATAHAPFQSLAVYVAVYAVLTAAGLPIAMGLTIAGGVLFGAVEGALAATGSASLAAVLGYAAARSALGPLAARWLGETGRLATFVADLQARGFWPILTGRLMPALPFALINYAAGIARVPLRTFLAATVVGGLPASVIFASLGSGVGADFSAAGLAAAVRSPQVWGPLLALSVLSALPILLRARRGKAA